MKTNFHHLAIKSADFGKSCTFYSEVLGFRKDLSWGEGDEKGAMFDTGNGSFIEVFAGGSPVKEIQSPVIHFAIEVDDCDHYYKKAIEAGAKSKNEPYEITIKGNERDLPVRIAFVFGPDGEEVEFFQNL